MYSTITLKDLSPIEPSELKEFLSDLAYRLLYSSIKINSKTSDTDLYKYLKEFTIKHPRSESVASVIVKERTLSSLVIVLKTNTGKQIKQNINIDI